MTPIVYFSSGTQNTHRFVQKLEIPATRIPFNDHRGTLQVEEPYVLIVPTYGRGRTPGHVPQQVVRFLNDEHNRALIRGVIAAGNTNFGESYCLAGDIISRKLDIPYLHRFELMGTPEDVDYVRSGLEQFMESDLWHRPHKP